MVWTRVTPPAGESEAPVHMEFARDEEFNDVLRRRMTVASAADDFCVRMSVTDLTPGSVFFFRFSAFGEVSPVGRTRTLPDGDAVRLAFVACASYGHGRFWSYGDVAARDDLDAVVHLGDYIYDTPGWGHPGTYGTSRQVDPPEGAVSLADYRRRYSQYRADPELQEMHRRHPVIAIWDDHEFADDPRPGGATGHDDGLHGSWTDRVRAASRAWHEWMPSEADESKIWRAFKFSSVLELVVVDRFHEALSGRGSDALADPQRRFVLDRAHRSTADWFVLGSGAGVASRRSDGVGGWPTELLDAMSDELGATPLLSVGGDSHRFEAVTFPPFADGPERLRGAEFAVGSVSSPGVELAGEGIGDHVVFADSTHRGYFVLTCTASVARADFFGVADAAVRSDDRPTEEWIAGFTVSRDGELVSAEAPAGDG